MKKFIAYVLILFLFLNSSINVFAAPKQMPDGTMFDAQFYAQTYPDVANALGTDEAALYNHYVQFGKAEGREPVANNNIINTQSTNHNYYKNIPKDVADTSDIYAKAIADTILSDKTLVTDLQKVQAAAETVSYLCSISIYGSDKEKYYRSPAGLLIKGVYTCAGSTRTLGRILDFMGYSWQHANENQNIHQWCILQMDGQIGFADGMGGFAGYGQMTNGMTLTNGRQIFFTQ